MQNRKYFPYERNNYYFGKLLTAKDFESEQRYFNDKRRLHNRLENGAGIAAGLGVVMADDASIILQAGCAYDAAGREIVVPETQIVKLSALEGYTSIMSTCAYLGIFYDEQKTDEVYGAMSNQEDGNCFNKTRESFKLTLLDENMVAKIAAPVDEYITTMSIYGDNEIQLIQRVPKYVAKESKVVVAVEMVRIGHGSSEYSFCYQLETPGFDGESVDGNEISQSHIHLAVGEKKIWHFTYQPKAHIWGGNSSVPFTVSHIKVQKSDETFVFNDKIESLLCPVQQNITELCLSNWYGKAMDKQLSESYDQRLWIAKINLIRQGAKMIIDSVSSAPFAQYSYNPQQMMLLHHLQEFYPDPLQAPTFLAGNPAQVAQTSVSSGVNMPQMSACGVYDLALGLSSDTKQAVFSEEIMHGLGKEPVYVEVGVEYIVMNPKTGDTSEIILGDAGIFDDYEKKSVTDLYSFYNLSTAVKILPERGTFIIGVKLNEVTNLISLRLRWFAFKVVDVSKQIVARTDGEKYILVNPDTIVLQPKGTTHITPVFINMPSEACNYRLTDVEGGSIDNNGVYTAPAKEGVYEIRIETISDPNVYTHAFVIVSQKKKEE